MLLNKSLQLPLRIARRKKGKARTQFAALPWRLQGGTVQICLITSRGSGRWILPKGWPINRQTPAEAAATEAREEAGLIGTPDDRCLGVYSYVKRGDRSRTPHLAMVYGIEVTQVLQDWDERRQRRRKWFSLAEAAARVDEPELRHIITGFDPLAETRRLG
ncbi:NUDIX hydrolase [Pseudoroseicyclus aestuarii]|uniref:NUDIX domain-containing protein n=1 Tax=Pseudoroseicyclus aestuarii TaxID=1795041 RepID=A0A318TBE0_9RHOB|nr:NUDIX hydrolase [Pseudoroseicyclus aestuarii]PYE85648.1 NUDIX domain-containing protein [Pseudoroseicyclus aestuarii]